MNKPHWKKLHDWWEEDFKFYVEQKSFFLGLLKKNPGDEKFIEIVKSIEKIIDKHQKEYKKLYGTRFNLRTLDERPITNG